MQETKETIAHRPFCKAFDYIQDPIRRMMFSISLLRNLVIPRYGNQYDSSSSDTLNICSGIKKGIYHQIVKILTTI